jgi:hypothetical protein
MARRRAIAFAGVAAGILIAASVVFVGIRSTEGDPEIPEELLATSAPVVVVTPPPPPEKVIIRGVEVTLPVEVTISRVYGDCVQPPCEDHNRYVIERLDRNPISVIVFDDYGVADYKIPPEDAALNKLLADLMALPWDEKPPAQ